MIRVLNALPLTCVRRKKETYIEIYIEIEIEKMQRDALISERGSDSDM